MNSPSIIIRFKGVSYSVCNFIAYYMPGYPHHLTSGLNKDLNKRTW